MTEMEIDQLVERARVIYKQSVRLEDELNIRQHWDGYPHTPGTLYDCPDCESQCFCDDSGDCVFCAIEAEGC